MKYNPYSISKIGTYNQCPHKFKLQYIDKIKVPFETNKALIKGKIIHQILEHNFDYDYEAEYTDVYTEADHKVSLDIVKRFEESSLGKSIKKFIAVGHLEEDFAFTFNKDLIGYWDKQAHLRGSADGYLVTKDKAVIIDYKTGKDRSQEEGYGLKQAKMYASYVLIKFPEVQEVKATFVFVEHCTKCNYTFKRDELDNFIEEFKYNIDKIESDKNYTKKTSPLCNWCNFYKHGHCDAREKIEMTDIRTGLDF